MTRLKIRNNVTGVIKYFNSRRGTGLVRLDDGSGEVFVNAMHSVDLHRLDRGVKVKFSMAANDNGERRISDLRAA